jgi:arylsulfatase A-like enzyme
LFPTVVELAGVTNAPPTDGVSLVPTLLGRPAKVRRDYLYWESHAGQFAQAIRAGDWKAIRPQPDAPLELYQLARDPGEARNVAADYPAVVNHLETLLKSARSESNVWETGKR